MKPLLICLALLTLVGRIQAGPVAYFAAALDGEALGQAVSFYDDASGQLSLTFVAAAQPDIESARWALVANELAAPLGEPFQPAATRWDAPYFNVTVQLAPKEIPAPQMRLLEIRLAHDPMPQVIPVMVYPAAQREALVEQLAQHRLYVDRRLEPVRALLDRYGLRHQGVDADRALQSDGPGIYFLIADGAPPANRNASRFLFAPQSAIVPWLEVERNRATYAYFDQLQLVGNAGAEMLVLQTAADFSQPRSTQVQNRHEESLF